MSINRNDIARLLVEALRVTNHRDYVVVGSLSILGAYETPPGTMAESVDIDLYPKNDPGRASDVARAFGQGSEFDKKYGFYADAVSPVLPSLPEGWGERLIKVDFDSGVTAWFLDPNDAAISKYVRSEPHDRRWIRAGLEAGIFSMPIIEYRLRETFMLDEEMQVAKASIAEDKAWLQNIQIAGRLPIKPTADKTTKSKSKDDPEPEQER
ncbi:hypothetical protein AGMMS50225_08460 [Betaproteobacteria bacterium]|nr:hypothetical protein AGMMS50225_08460 [Betaproteobacteria bacterium]